MKRIGFPLLAWFLVHALAAAGPLSTGFAYGDFSGTTGLVLLGDATIVDGALRLTAAAAGQTGAAWSNALQPVTAGFQTDFQFAITDPGCDGFGCSGADGFAFVVQRAGFGAIGGGGGAMGYGGIANSLAVEFDTWQNFVDPEASGDPNDNHVGIQSRGTPPNSARLEASLGHTDTALAVDLSDGLPHTARIRYLPGMLTVYLDDLTAPVLSATVDLGELLDLPDGKAVVGFTSATGGAWENHDILDWTFRSVPEPGALPLVTVGLTALAFKRRKRWPKTWGLLAIIAAVTALTGGSRVARADIYQWEYIDPNDPSQGKQQSATLAPDGAGVEAVPGADLSYRNLSMAFLPGANLKNVHALTVDLTNADLSDADLSHGRFTDVTLKGASLNRANLTDLELLNTALTDTDLSEAEVRGARFDRLMGFTNGQFFYNGTGVTLLQLYSTASYKSHDLSGISLESHGLSGGNFSGQNLTGASFIRATLTNADFTNAVVRGAGFQRTSDNYAGWGKVTFGTGITLSQLYSTASYQAGDLSGISLWENDLTDGDFAGQNLADSNFQSALLTGADFEEADLTRASFRFATLTGADFRRANATKVDFSGAMLNEADFRGAEVRGAKLSASGQGITLAQIYSTASYQAQDLSQVDFSYNDLSGGNFAEQNLTGANFGGADLTGTNFRYAGLVNASFVTVVGYPPGCIPGLTGPCNPIIVATSLANADLRGADARGAGLLVPAGATAENFIDPDGHVAGLEIEAGDQFLVRDYADDLALVAITVDEHLTMGPGGTLRMVFKADAWDSTIFFEPGIPVTLGGTLELTFTAEVDLASQVGRTLKIFDWTDVDPVGRFAVAGRGDWDVSQLYTTGEITLLAVLETAPAWQVVLIAGIAVATGRCRRSGLCRPTCGARRGRRSSRRLAGSFQEWRSARG